MRFKSGADVHSLTGEKVGRLKGVVVAPGGEQVTGLIVERGFIFSEDHMIPVESIAQTTQDGDIQLNIRDEDLDELPRFDEGSYIPAEPAGTTPTGMPMSYIYYGLPGAGYVGSGSLVPPPTASFAADAIRQQRESGATTSQDAQTSAQADASASSEGGVHLRIGADVVSSDDQRVGRVSEILASSADGKITHFIIEKGVLSTSSKLVPIQWIAHMDDNHVHLGVNKEFLTRLPDYTGEIDTQGEEYATENASDPDDIARGAVEDTDRDLSQSPYGDVLPHRDTERADNVGVETSRSRDWERTGGMSGSDATLPADGDDDPGYDERNDRPIQGT